MRRTDGPGVNGWYYSRDIPAYHKSISQKSRNEFAVDLRIDSTFSRVAGNHRIGSLILVSLSHDNSSVNFYCKAVQLKENVSNYKTKITYWIQLVILAVVQYNLKIQSSWRNFRIGIYSEPIRIPVWNFRQGSYMRIIIKIWRKKWIRRGIIKFLFGNLFQPIPLWTNTKHFVLII